MKVRWLLSPSTLRCSVGAPSVSCLGLLSRALKESMAWDVVRRQREDRKADQHCGAAPQVSRGTSRRGSGFRDPHSPKQEREDDAGREEEREVRGSESSQRSFGEPWIATGPKYIRKDRCRPLDLPKGRVTRALRAPSHRRVLVSSEPRCRCSRCPRGQRQERHCEDGSHGTRRRRCDRGDDDDHGEHQGV